MDKALIARLIVVLAGFSVVVAATPAMAAAVPPRDHVEQAQAAPMTGIAVYDRGTSTYRQRRNEHGHFRSASLVKLLIALDLLWDRGPRYELPADDRQQFDLMLRSSDDAAASEFWQRGGQGPIVDRMVARLGLHDTAPPPPEHPGWGFTTVSADDIVLVYRYLLDAAPAPVRDLIMGDLHQATRCGTDGFDQSFGIAGAFTGTHAVKQGWSGFGRTPRDSCTEAPAARGYSAALDGKAGASAAPVDYVRTALHTTGTVGAGDRTIVAVLTVQAPGTSFAQAAFGLTMLTRGLNVPGAARAPVPPIPPPGTWFATWSSGVPVRAAPTSSSAQVGTVPSGMEVLVKCQLQGELVVVGDIRNDWWAYLPELGGYMSNVYFTWPDNQLPSVVPACCKAP